MSLDSFIKLLILLTPALHLKEQFAIVIAADCAYSLTEHLVTPYSGPQHFLERNDNFNFFLSQRRIRIEMAFGLLVTMWRILHTPINVKFSNLRKLLSGIIRLHNYCINNHEEKPLISQMYKISATQQHPHEPSVLGYIPSDAPNVISREGVSQSDQSQLQHGQVYSSDD
jgi:hypothetical protein